MKISNDTNESPASFLSVSVSVTPEAADEDTNAHRKNLVRGDRESDNGPSREPAHSTKNSKRGR